ncbi:PTS glucose transporter subunit IIA [uncultured Corynebacterium sp.]|uniref:PTS sugar transporter subunit IIA n=1 Tax=uncultured Corynebacterium sp. TaxID=159447 RepID=UPI0025EE6234|nr:PTS glucose transporter subunit IIA [uncultured Corynebacterium sp.]
MTDTPSERPSEDVTTSQTAPHKSATGKDNVVEIVAPVSGRVIPIEDVPDPMFSEKVVGDGLGISKPKSGKILAPVSGKVMMVAKTGHAFALKTENGLEVLVHLGIDTVELKGEPFDMTISRGDQLHAGDKVGIMDVDVIKSAGKDTTVIVAITNTAKKLDDLKVTHKAVTSGDPVAAATLKSRSRPRNRRRAVRREAARPAQQGEPRRDPLRRPYRPHPARVPTQDKSTVLNRETVPQNVQPIFRATTPPHGMSSTTSAAKTTSVR